MEGEHAIGRTVISPSRDWGDCRGNIGAEGAVIVFSMLRSVRIGVATVKMSALFLACLLPGLFGLPCAAQSTSAPEDPVAILVKTALESNPGLKAQRLKVSAALEKPHEARALPDPAADVEFMMLPASHLNARDAVTKGVSVGITQALPYPGKRKLREDKARREAEAAEAYLHAMESDLAGEVKVAAYRYALYIRLLELNSRKAGSLRAAEQGAMGLYSSGGGTQADLLSAQTAITRNEKERLGLEQELDITAARLDDLLGGQAERALLDKVALAEVSWPPRLESLLAGSRKRAPRVIAAQAGEQVEEQQADIARSDFKPDFTVGGRYRHNDVTMGGGNYFTVMAGMTLPFFHRKDRYQPALEEALAKREGAKQETSNVINQVRYELTEAWQNASHDRAVFDLLQNGLLIQVKQAYESSLNSYSAGRTDFATLLKALADFYDYQGEALTAQADFLMARSRMEALLGLPSLELATDVGTASTDSSPDNQKEN